MKVLEDHIEDNKHNFTRFLVLSQPQKADMLRPLTEADKSSIVFSLPHEEGSLSAVLPQTGKKSASRRCDRDCIW